MHRRARADGLSNCLTGLGIDEGDDTLDTRVHTRRFVNNYWRSVEEFEAEWEQSWMANREVSQMPRDMFREGFDLVNVEPPIDMAKVRAHIDTVVEMRPDGSMDSEPGINWYARQLREQGDKVGGAALFAILDDGLDPVEPLDLRRIQRVVGWEVFDRSEITPYSVGYNIKPQYYVLSDVLAAPRPGRLSASGHPLTDERTLKPGDVIHVSRLWIHPGRVLSRRQMRYRFWWGASVLELNERERRSVEESSEYLRTYIDRASWIWVSFAELDELLTKKDENGNDVGDEALRKHLKAIRKYTKTLGILPTDAGRGAYETEGQKIPERKPDQVKSVTESTGDLTKIAEWDLKQWARGSRMPASLALNEVAGGLRGGDDKGDQQRWNGEVRSEQNNWATLVVNWMLTILFCSREGPTAGVLPTWEVSWRPLYIPTPMEQAKLDLARAQADGERISQKSVLADEVRSQRFIEGDAHGPLRVTVEEDEAETEVGIGPALVGIATQVLAGAIAVGQGQITPEFYALYLTSIDEQRYPPDRAMEVAQAVSAQPFPVEGDGEGGPAPTEDAEPNDPLRSLFANIEPGDLRTPRAIAEELSKRSGLDIKTRAISDLIRREGLQPVSIGNKSGYSLRQVAAALGARDEELDQPDGERMDRAEPVITRALRILGRMADAVSGVAPEGPAS